MDILLFAVMFVLGLVGSFFSGLLGIGGAIINYPLLLFVPAALGVAHFSGQEVSSISMFQVLFASLSGVLAFRRRTTQGGGIHKGLVLYMGGSTLVGSLLGGLVSGYLASEVINLVYGILAAVAVVLMLIPNRGVPESKAEPLSFNRLIAMAAALIIGLASGVVGAGGAFMLIPVMLTILNIPPRTAIASSLAIVLFSAIGGVVGKVATMPLPLGPVLYTILGSLAGAPLGARIGAKISVKYLRYGLVAIIAFTAVKIWWSLL